VDRGQPPVDHAFVTTAKPKAAAAARIGAALGCRKRAELLGLLRPCFARTEPWLQAGKYVRACLSDLGKRNGWSIAEQAGDATPDKTQRLLNHACWDAAAAVSVIRRFVIGGLDGAGGAAGLRIGALDETGQEKAGAATAGVKRQYMGCAGRVANGINTVHLSYVCQHRGHGLVGFRQWIPAGQLEDPGIRARMGLPAGLAFATKGELAVQILADAAADGMVTDFVCGDEVYGSSPALRCYLEEHAQGYVLRVAKTFLVGLGGAKLSCAKVVTRHLKARRRWTVASAGTGSKGERDYAWAWVATASPRHWLVIRRHLGTGECAYHYCHVPDGQPVSLKRLITAAGLRWPVEEGFEFGKDYFGLDQSQVRLHTAITRHTVLVMAALAVCVIAAARARPRTDTQAPPPASPDDLPPADPGLIPLTVAEVKRLLNAATARPRPAWHAAHWSQWRRRHQARARWHHKRARLARQPQFAQVKP
jgi:SRSO17 transposase